MKVENHPRNFVAFYPLSRVLVVLAGKEVINVLDFCCRVEKIQFFHDINIKFKRTWIRLHL